MAKYPEVEVQLTGEDGNVFSILGRCKKASRGKMTNEQFEEFSDELMSGDYNNALITVQEYFTVS